MIVSLIETFLKKIKFKSDDIQRIQANLRVGHAKLILILQLLQIFVNDSVSNFVRWRF